MKAFLVCAIMVVLGISGVLFMLGRERYDMSAIFIADDELKVVVVDTPELRAQGLSGKESLVPYDAMLFTFPVPGIYGFWMKDMRFAIDIVWIDSSMRIADITKNISPDTYPKTFEPKVPSMYVLELPAGQAKSEWLGETVIMR